LLEKCVVVKSLLLGRLAAVLPPRYQALGVQAAVVRQEEYPNVQYCHEAKKPALITSSPDILSRY